MLEITQTILDDFKDKKRVSIKLDDPMLADIITTELRLAGKYCVYNSKDEEIVYLADYYYVIMLDQYSKRWYQYFEGLYGDALYECLLCEDQFERAEEKGVHSFEDLFEKDLWSVPAEQLKIVDGFTYMEYAEDEEENEDDDDDWEDDDWEDEEDDEEIIEYFHKKNKRPKKKKTFGKRKTRKRR